MGFTVIAVVQRSPDALVQYETPTSKGLQTISNTVKLQPGSTVTVNAINGYAKIAYIAIDESTKVYVLVSGTDFPDAEGLLSLDDFSSTRDGVKRSAYGHFDNVLLSDKEHSKLQTEFPDDYDARIDRLSTYIESSGKQYRNHYAAIRSWAKNDQKKSASSNNPFLELAGGSYD